MKRPDFLTSCRLVNFKAIRTTRTLRLSPLTVFIGNNGAGKSSVVEGLRTFQVIVEEGIDAAVQLWRGVEHAYHKAAPTLPDADEPTGSSRKWGMTFSLKGRVRGSRYAAKLQLVPSPDRDRIARLRERLTINERKLGYPASGWAKDDFWLKHIGESGITEKWQFLSLVPQHMMPPVPRKTTRGRVRLVEDGRNIAEYLEEIRNLDEAAFDGIIAALQFVVPFMSDVRPESASKVEKTLYLELVEPGLTRKDKAPEPRRQKIPGWMMSTGTLRALAIIAALRHPEPPSLLAIDEIENSLDPRTLGFVMEEIRRAVKAGRTQVILTTHSPQLLDLVLLEHLVFVERNEAGEPVFRRPADNKEVRKWAESFTPGQMFARGLFGQLS